MLLIETTDPAALRAVHAAVDRGVRVFEPKTIDPAELDAGRAVLKRGDVVGVLTEAPAARAFADSLDALKLGVRTEGTRVVFGDSSAS